MLKALGTMRLPVATGICTLAWRLVENIPNLEPSFQCPSTRNPSALQSLAKLLKLWSLGVITTMTRPRRPYGESIQGVQGRGGRWGGGSIDSKP